MRRAIGKRVTLCHADGEVNRAACCLKVLRLRWKQLDSTLRNILWEPVDANEDTQPCGRRWFQTALYIPLMLNECLIWVQHYSCNYGIAVCDHALGSTA
ncbi:hypothetical protein MHYP_G00008920 [Metynnis hypsauchen]